MSCKICEKKNWREKKKWGQRVFVHTAYLIMGFPTDFFLFFFDFQTLRLTRHYSCIFWQPENTPPSLYNVHVYAAVWPLCFRTRPLNPESSTLTSRPKGRGRCDRTAHLYRRFSFQSFLKLKRELFWLLKNRNTKSLHHHLKCWAVVLFDIPCLHYQFRKKIISSKALGKFSAQRDLRKKTKSDVLELKF